MTAPTLKTILPELTLGDAASSDSTRTSSRARTSSASARTRAEAFARGEPYVHHCVEVAKILAELHLDSSTVASGLIHDVVEDTAVTVADVAAEFGKEIAAIVDGVTKIGNISFQLDAGAPGRELPQAAALDREGRARHPDQARGPAAQHAHARLSARGEAPPHRAGDDGSLRAARAPLRHGARCGGSSRISPSSTSSRRSTGRSRSSSRRSATSASSSSRRCPSRSSGSSSARESRTSRSIGRPKHLWSIYKKMKPRDKPYEEIYDLMAVRVLVNRVPECYHALGVIHDGWTPLQERIKDYIAQPKSNGYQSLHTTVFGPGRQLYEVQIRTREMHRTAEYGIAAHWLYKENANERRQGRAGHRAGCGRCWSSSSTRRIRTSSSSSSSSISIRRRSSFSRPRAT